jgi:hypothetical protein
MSKFARFSKLTGRTVMAVSIGRLGNKEEMFNKEQV